MSQDLLLVWNLPSRPASFRVYLVPASSALVLQVSCRGHVYWGSCLLRPFLTGWTISSAPPSCVLHGNKTWVCLYIPTLPPSPKLYCRNSIVDTMILVSDFFFIFFFIFTLLHFAIHASQVWADHQRQPLPVQSVLTPGLRTPEAELKLSGRGSQETTLHTDTCCIIGLS